MADHFSGVAFVLECSPPWTAFGGSATSGDPQVYAACSSDAAGTATQYTDFAGFTDADQCHNPVLSPDGTKILFEVLGASTGYREVWVVDATPGSSPTQLVADASNYVVHPAWGPDSDTFVYVHCSGGALLNGTIYKDTVSSPGSPVSLKVASGSSPWRPQFNFDGTRVAYIYDANASAACDLRCMDADGTNDASLDNTIGGYTFTQPPQFSWANTQNLIAYSDAQFPAGIFVIDDAGAGKTQINANGDAAGANSVVSGEAWPSDDSFVVITANLGVGGFFSVVRAEVDGSDTTALNASRGSVNQGWFEAAKVYGNRIWFISATDASASKGRISSVALDGTDLQDNFDSSLGSGDQVAAFAGGDGWYFN